MKNDNQPFTPVRLGRAQLTALIEASKLLNGTLDRDEVLRRLMTLAARGVDADRATLYLLDEPRRELCSIVMLGEGLCEIRLPLEEGLAGYVARTGETVSVADAYADPRFSRRIDEETGYRTRTVLAVPMRDPQGRISGVVQAVADHTALTIESARRYESLLRVGEYQKKRATISLLDPLTLLRG